MFQLRKSICLATLSCLLATLLPSTLRAQQPKYPLVAANDCGVDGKQPFLVLGESYTMPSNIKGSVEAVTCNFGGKVVYAFNHLDIHADYQLEVVFLADHDRRQRIVVDGNELQPPTDLPAGREQRYLIDLPRKAYAYSQLVLVFELAGRGDNALVSAVNLYSSNPKAPVPFAGAEKQALKRTTSYRVDKHIDVEAALPTYAALPAAVPGTYCPVLSLNGTWQFCPNPPADFHRSPTAKGEWSDIAVPGEWAMQGFKVDSAAFAAYRRTFRLPADWKGRTVKIRFDGVHSEYRIYVNGAEAGYHLGGMTPCELDITRHLREGENEVALAVRSESLADMLGSLTQYAAHQLGGITRKVTLFALPPTHVSDLRIVTDLDSCYKDATLNVRATVANASAATATGLRLRMSIDGMPGCVEQALPAIAANGEWSGMLNRIVKAPTLWDNEHPNLHTLRVQLLSEGKIVETLEKRFGFREVEVKGNELHVNGRPVKLRGVCHHEMHPLAGRVVSAELERRDVELYRAANCNFIRTSHYPPIEELLDICDELGMFVEVEAPVCWVGHHANENWKRLNYRDSTYYPYILQANMENIHFNRNHPSVLFWSIANESYWNGHFAQIEEYVNQADPTRPHTFHDQAYGGFNNQGSTGQIANIHYPGPDGYKVAAGSERPMVYGEYCHLNVYNRSELVTDPGVRSDWALALVPTWENMYHTKGVLGGSLWSGIDDVFQMPGGQAVGYGPWGPIDGWRRPKPEYWDMKKAYSPVRVTTTTLQPARTLCLDVENRHTYLNLGEMRIAWRYGTEQGFAHADIAPGEKGCIEIPVSNPGAANALYVSFADPRGFVADEYLVPVGRQSQNELPAPRSAPTRVKAKKDRFLIIGRGFHLEVSRTTGQVLTLSQGGTVKLVGGPTLMALPLTGGGCYPNHNANTPVWSDLCSGWQAKSVSAEQRGNDVVVTVEGSYKEFAGSYTLTANAAGELAVAYRFTALADVNPRQWGLVFDAPRSFDTAFWRRDGKWSVYPADHISRPAGEAPSSTKACPAMPIPAWLPRGAGAWMPLSWGATIFAPPAATSTTLAFTMPPEHASPSAPTGGSIGVPGRRAEIYASSLPTS